MGPFFILIKNFILSYWNYLYIQIYSFWIGKLIIPLCNHLLYFSQAGYLADVYYWFLKKSLWFGKFYEEKILSKNLFFIIFFLFLDGIRSFFFSLFERFVSLIRLFIQFLIEGLLLGFLKTIKEKRWTKIFKNILIGFIISFIFLFFSIPLNLTISFFLIYMLFVSKRIIESTIKTQSTTEEKDFNEFSIKEKIILIMEHANIYFELKAISFNEKIMNDYEQLFNEKKFYKITLQWYYEIILHKHFLKTEKNILKRAIIKKLYKG